MVTAISDKSHIIEGNHMGLRRVEADDAPLLHRLMQEGKLDLYKPYLASFHPDEEKIAQIISFHQSIDPFIEVEYFILCMKTMLPTGLVSIQGIDPYNKKAEISLTIFKRSAFRQGAEAFWTAVNYAFDRLLMEKLIFHVAENNTSFLKLLEKRKWQPEARLGREIITAPGKRVDVLRFAIFPETVENSLFRSIARLSEPKKIKKNPG